MLKTHVQGFLGFIKRESGEAYNIESGEYLKNIKVANSILKSLDLDSSL